MAELSDANERVRKAYSPKGERGQKMISFRLDNENVEWLNSKPNKGRYINDLIAQDRNNNSCK